MSVQRTPCAAAEQFLYSVGVPGCVNVPFDVSGHSNANKGFCAGCVGSEIHQGVGGRPHALSFNNLCWKRF